jgi:hypothetical protein
VATLVMTHAGPRYFRRLDPSGYDELMREVARAPEEKAPAPPRATPAPGPATVAARALALQRSAGNRAASRVLARWTKHPDAEQKGVMVPDSSAAEYTHFNPPKNE